MVVLEARLVAVLDKLMAVLSDNPNVGLSAKPETRSGSVPKGEWMHVCVL